MRQHTKRNALDLNHLIHAVLCNVKGCAANSGHSKAIGEGGGHLFDQEGKARHGTKACSV